MRFYNPEDDDVFRTDTAAELLTPLSVSDLPAVDFAQAEIEKHELLQARQEWLAGRAYAYCAGPGQPLVMCCSEADLVRAREVRRGRS